MTSFKLLFNVFTIPDNNFQSQRIFRMKFKAIFSIVILLQNKTSFQDISHQSLIEAQSGHRMSKKIFKTKANRNRFQNKKQLRTGLRSDYCTKRIIIYRVYSNIGLEKVKSFLI